MTKPPVTISADEPVTHAARPLFDRRIKRLPVISDDGALIGIVSRSDVLSVYSQPDADVQHQVAKETDRGHFPVRPDRFTVTVMDGIVTIKGNTGNHHGRPRHHRRRPAHGRRRRRTRPAQLPPGLAVPPPGTQLMVPATPRRRR
jgi:CBS domain